MSKVVEALVAKGRRVSRPREQREIAFGLADLSTHEEMHERIVKKGGIKTLISLLSKSNDVEAQRFAALAIANCASASCNRITIAKDGDTVVQLINCIKNDERDATMRQYCAMALGNLSAEPQNHDEIAKLGGIHALVILLQCGTQDVESGRYAAFAISNFAANGNHRQQIVDEGAIDSLVILCCNEDSNAQRQALSALRGICITPEHRVKVVQLGIIDPLVLLARSDNVEILREVSAALNCLSCMDENKEEIADRAISTILSMLISGDVEVERHACCTIANLVEIIDVQSRFLEERGIPPLIAASVSTDLNTKGEASRAIANLAANADIQQILLQEGVLDSMVEALEKDEINCQRFAALCMANLATTVSSQIKVVQAGAIGPLVSLTMTSNSNLEVRRYSILALANLSATVANQPAILEAGGLDAIFSLSNSPDAMSQYYVGCALANLSCNTSNHLFIAEEGGIQPLVTLAYSKDPDIQLQASTALRGLTVTDDIKMKIVQEGCLEPLIRMLVLEDVEILRECCACLCNISLGDENKYEIARSGAVAPIINCMQSEDMFIASQSSACLANLAEMTENQEIIAKEGGVKPCIATMRSRYIEVQRESGRLIANICASEIPFVTAQVIAEGGHQLLISFLLSQDTACQRVGAFGIGNLCTHQEHRVTLVTSGVLEPLCSLARAEDSELEIQRFAVLALTNLASCVENQQVFIDEGMLPILISLSSSPDAEVRQYAAFALVKIAENSDTRKIVTEEGGLEPVLYLARTVEHEIQREVLPAIATLSFANDNKFGICMHGGLPPVIAGLVSDDKKMVMYACCAIANLTENIDNMAPIVNSNAIPLLVSALEIESARVQREAARALGNLAANIDYGKMIMNQDALKKLIQSFESSNDEKKGMAAMALSNLSSNIMLHGEIMKQKVLEPITAECQAVLDPKSGFDHESARFCLLIISNLSVSLKYHTVLMDYLLDILISFTKDGDIKCRHHALYTLGNLCCNKENFSRLVQHGCIKILITFAFPVTTGKSTDAQFQAIAGLRGLATSNEYRKRIVQEGGLEPLILSASVEDNESDIEIKREAAAAFSNLALALENKVLMSRSGVISALIKLSKIHDDTCKVFAVAALANLAELEGNVQKRMIDEGCLKALLSVADFTKNGVEVQNEVSRCLALFTCNPDSHPQLIQTNCFKKVVNFLNPENHVSCQRFSSLAIGNLAVVPINHQILFDSGALSALLILAKSDDNETTQCVAFALSNIARFEINHRACEKMGFVQALISLLHFNDRNTQFQACLAVRYLCVSPRARIQFVESKGLPPLLSFAKVNSIESNREAAAALRNLSLFDPNKVAIVKNGGIDALVDLCHSCDHEVSHQACGVIANLAELSENIGIMINAGILQHLKYAMRSTSIDVKREAVRAIANLASEATYIADVVGEGAMIPLIECLSSPDILCQRFGSMGVANVATNKDVQEYIIQADAVVPLIKILDKKSDTDSQRYALFCLTNIAAVKKNHVILLEYDMVKLACLFLSSNDVLMRESAVLCLANLASNSSTHKDFLVNNCLNDLLKLLLKDDNRIRLQAVSALRGLSANHEMRSKIIRLRGLESLLEISSVNDVELQMEVLATLCNLSLEGCIGENPSEFLQKMSMNNLISFLCSSDSTYRLFGALAIGNIASDENLHHPVIESGALGPLISMSNSASLETQRCIAYAICNLAVIQTNRPMVIRDGGLSPLIRLCCNHDKNDMVAGLATLRGLAADPEARRAILKAGVLEAISCGAAESLCQVEAASLLCALSLNEENKFDIMNSDIFGDIVLLAKSSDFNACEMAVRSIGNFCENENLHRQIVNHHGVGYLIQLLHRRNLELTREVLRCFTNLSANYEMHGILTSKKVPMYMAQIFQEKDDLSNCYASIGLMNISMRKENHACMDIPNLFHALHQFLEKKLVLQQNISESELRCMRNAFLAIGGLCINREVHPAFVNQGIIMSIINAFEMHDKELRLTAIFTLNKLALDSRNMEALTCEKLIISVINMINGMEPNTKVLAVSVLRKLSLSCDNCQHIVKNGGLSALSSAFYKKSIEMRREIAACICHLSLPEEFRMHLVNSAILEPLLSLTQSEDIEVARFGLGALANIAEHSSSHQMLVEHKNIVHFVTLSSRNRHVEIHREATRAISNFLSFHGAHDKFLSENGLKSLFAISRSSDLECQYNAALCFRKLSLNISNHESLVVDGQLQSMIHLALVENSNVQLQAASALMAIASNRDMKNIFSEQGGLNTSVSLLTSPCLKLTNIGMGILCHLSSSTIVKNHVKENIFTAILDIGLSHDDNDILRHCAGTIANLSECKKVKGFVIDQGVLKVIIRLASKNESKIQCHIARAFSFFSSSVENCQNLVESHTIEKIPFLLTREEEACSRDAAATIGNLATNERTQIFISKCGGFTPLIQQLESQFESVQINVCRALYRLAIPHQNKTELVSGLESLLGLLHTSNSELRKMCLMVLCNISVHSENNQKIVDKGGLVTLIDLLRGSDQSCQYAILKTLCNLSMKYTTQAHIVNLGGLVPLLHLTTTQDMKSVELSGMVLCNLAINPKNYPFMVEHETLHSLINMTTLSGYGKIQRVAVLALYNLSAYKSCHLDMLSLGISKPLVLLCNADELECKQYAVMLLANLAANFDTRKQATKGGGLQAAIKLLKDKDLDCNRYACICLSNMGNALNTQRQIVVHGGLSLLIHHANNSDSLLKQYAIMCLVNLSALESNHPFLIKAGALKIFINQFNCEEYDIQKICGFGIANLCSNDELLNKIRLEGGMEPLMTLANSKNAHARCLGLSALRRLSTIQNNREALIDNGVLSVLFRAGDSKSLEIQREVGACLCNLTLSTQHKMEIAINCLTTLKNSSLSKDIEASRQSAGALANISEESKSHDFLQSHGVIECVKELLRHENIDIHREASRLLSNMLTSYHLHEEITQNCFELIFNRVSNADPESKLYLSISLRKLSKSTKAHEMIQHTGFSNLFLLLKDQNLKIKKNTATAIRDLCSNNRIKKSFAEAGGIEELVNVLKRKHIEVQTLVTSALRHLSLCDDLKRKMVKLDALQPCMRSISYATEDLKCQIMGLFSNLSENSANQIEMLEKGVTPIIVELAKTESAEIKQDCARTLANLCATESNQAPIYRQNGMHCLLALVNCCDGTMIKYVALALRFLISNPIIHADLVDEKLLHFIVTLSKSSILEYQKTAASSFAYLSVAEDTKTFLIRKGALNDILSLAKLDEVQIRRDVIFCLANLSDSPELQVDIVNVGTIEIIQKAGLCLDMTVQRNVARAFSSLSTTNDAKEKIIQQGALQLLFSLARSEDLPTQRYAALSICNVSNGEKRGEIMKNEVLKTILFLLRFPDLETEQLASLAIASLSLGSCIDNKKRILREGFLQLLIEKLKFPDIEIQRCAAIAMNSIVLGKCNRIKEEIMDRSGLPQILALVESKDEGCVHLSIYLLGSVAENDEVRAKLIELKTIGLVTRRMYSPSIEIKRASGYFLMLIASSVEFHDALASYGGLEALIHLASMADLECQEYASFSLAYLASNREYQVKLVQLGAVRPLVSIMAADDESKHYAGLALLKLADNFENHLTIAEEGGIQALLQMGRNQVTDEELQYKAALTVGHLASNAVNLMPNDHMKRDVIGYASESLQKQKNKTISKTKTSDLIADSLEKLTEGKNQ